MPPGTGDVPLTVFQSLPVDGVVIVTSPQDLVQMIVEKAYNMAIGMSGLWKENICIWESHIDDCRKLGVEVLGKMPIDPKLAGDCRTGEVL